MGADRLERLGQTVGLGLVVARDDPDLAAHLDPDLGRAGHVARRVEGDRASPIREPRHRDLRRDRDVAQPVADHRRGGVGGEVAGVAGAGVVGMAVGDERAVDRAPGVDEEVARGQ
jgi:hypothetical protein